jgi:hypothetical protein
MALVAVEGSGFCHWFSGGVEVQEGPTMEYIINQS